MKIFYIIEARDPDTRHLEHRRVYTTEEQYLIRGMKQVEKFNELYDVKVTKYICNESVEVLNLKADELPPTEMDVVKLNESDIKHIVKRVLNEQMEFEPKGMDFWLEELSEFAIHLENGVYDEHDELSFDDLTEYDIGEIQRILEDAMEDKTLNDNERTLVYEYGQGIIDSIQRKIY